MECLIDVAGRSRKIGTRNVAVAVAKLGNVHIRSVGRTVIITLQPETVSEVALAAAGYKIGDLSPERVILVAGVASARCWVFSGYRPAFSKIDALRRARYPDRSALSDGARGYSL